MVGDKGRKTMDGFEGENKAFVLNVGVQSQLLERKKRGVEPPGRRGETEEKQFSRWGGGEFRCETGKVERTLQ